ncbi:porin [Terricaulis sp.]|uniref:porin n=1 Tax=Terricaulis sp. TaxID=2768686 RepID=UPI003783C3D0
MKKYLLGAVALMAIVAPGVAAAQSAYVDLGYQNTDVDVAGTNADGDSWSIGGAAAWQHFQLDGAVIDGDAATNWNLGGHVFNRTDAGLIGGFANWSTTDVDGAGDFDAWTIGAEGQLYLSRTTLNGALSYSDSEDLDANMTAIDLGLRHFVTDRFAIGANAGYGWIDAGAAGDENATTLGLDAEYQFNGPVSIFGGYQRVDLDDADASADTFSIGVRYNLGGSLFDRDRSGAGLSRAAGLGRFGGLF